MNNPRQTFFTLAAAGLLALSLSNCGPTGETIKIGGVAPMTGPQAELGQDLVNGMRLAVEEINAAGGLLGKQLVLVAMDDKADPKEAVVIANKLVVDPDVIGIVGHLNSGATLPASAVYHRTGLPLVMPVPTNPTITRQGFGNIFRVCPTDADQGPQAARFAFENLKLTRYAILHDKTAYGQGLADEFKKEAERLGAEIVLCDGVTEGQTDFSPVLTKTRGLKPELLYFGGMYPEGALIVKQSRELEIDAVFMTGDGCFTPEFTKIGGTGTEGAVVSFLAPPWREREMTREFVEKYEAKFGEIKNYAPFGYDAVRVLANALEKAGKVDRKAAIEELARPDFSHDGVVGLVEFTPNGDNRNAILFFYRVDDGKFSPAE